MYVKADTVGFFPHPYLTAGKVYRVDPEGYWGEQTIYDDTDRPLCIILPGDGPCPHLNDDNEWVEVDADGNPV